MFFFSSKISSISSNIALVQFGRPMWQVLTGRKDGRVSLATEASRDLPSGNANFTTLQQQFAGLGLNIIDLVALSGIYIYI